MEVTEEESLGSEVSIAEVVEVEEEVKTVGKVEETKRDNDDKQDEISEEDEEDLNSISSISATSYSDETVREEDTPRREESTQPSSNEPVVKPNAPTANETRCTRPASSTGSGRDLKPKPVATGVNISSTTKLSRCDSASRIETSACSRRVPKKDELKKLFQSTDILSRPKAALNFAKTLDKFSRWGITTPTHAAQSNVIRKELEKSILFEDQAVKLDCAQSFSLRGRRRGQTRCKARKATASKGRVRPKLKPIQGDPTIPTKKLYTKSEKKEFIEMLHKLIRAPQQDNLEASSEEYDMEAEDEDDESYLSEEIRSVES